MKKVLMLLALSIMIITVPCCKKEKSSEATPTPTPAPVATDTTVNVDLVIVAYNSGGVPPTLLRISNSVSSVITYQDFHGSDISPIQWYNTTSPPVIASPCTTGYIPIVLKFSKVNNTIIDVDLDGSIRDCSYTFTTNVITNNAGTFTIDRTCKPGKWVILCSK